MTNVDFAPPLGDIMTLSVTIIRERVIMVLTIQTFPVVLEV